MQALTDYRINNIILVLYIMNIALLALFITILFVLKKNKAIQSSYEQLIIFTIFCVIITTKFDQYLITYYIIYMFMMK